MTEPIRLFVTGGTFDKEYNEREGSLYFQDTHVGAMLKLGRSLADVEVRTLMMVDSLEMSDEDRQVILAQCRSCPRDRIVITHGTDTMEETAYFLSLTVGGCEPVILTGAMRQANWVGADGPANLRNAIRTAVAPTARGRGTLVLMNDEIFAARDVTKSNTTRLDAFTAPDAGVLGLADPDTVVFHRPAPAVAGRCAAPRFDLERVADFPRVDVVYAYVGSDSVQVDALVNAGARGLVLAGVGRGGATPAMSRALERATERGVTVVISNRTGSGRVGTGRGDGQRDPSSPGRGATIGATDLNPQKARILLMLALAAGLDAGAMANLFDAR